MFTLCGTSNNGHPTNNTKHTFVQRSRLNVQQRYTLKRFEVPSVVNVKRFATCCELEKVRHDSKTRENQNYKRVKKHDVIVKQFASDSLVPSTVVVTKGQEVLFSTVGTSASPKQTTKTCSTWKTDPRAVWYQPWDAQSEPWTSKPSFSKIPENRGHERHDLANLTTFPVGQTLKGWGQILLALSAGIENRMSQNTFPSIQNSCIHVRKWPLIDFRKHR